MPSLLTDPWLALYQQHRRESDPSGFNRLLEARLLQWQSDQYNPDMASLANALHGIDVAAVQESRNICDVDSPVLLCRAVEESVFLTFPRQLEQVDAHGNERRLEVLALIPISSLAWNTLERLQQALPGALSAADETHTVRVLDVPLYRRLTDARTGAIEAACRRTLHRHLRVEFGKEYPWRDNLYARLRDRWRLYDL